MRIIQTAAPDEKEQFHFMRWRFKPRVIWDAIEKGKIPKQEKEMDISAWAKKMLGIDLEHPDEEPMGFVRVDLKRAKDIPPSNAGEPGLLVLMGRGDGKFSLIIDGNHRIAKRYLAGEKLMRFYIVTEAQLKKIPGAMIG